MARILIVYGTTDGHTPKVVAALRAAFEKGGCNVDTFDARRIPKAAGTEGYDGVVVAASIHIGNYQRAVKRWVRSHAAELGRRPSAFLSVCLAILEDRPEPRQEVNDIMQRFLRRSRWQPTVTKHVAGALPYTRYNWLKKRIMKRIATKTGGGTDTARDYEYTDWDDLRCFAADFARRAAGGAAEDVGVGTVAKSLP